MGLITIKVKQVSIDCTNIYSWNSLFYHHLYILAYVLVNIYILYVQCDVKNNTCHFQKQEMKNKNEYTLTNKTFQFQFPRFSKNTVFPSLAIFPMHRAGGAQSGCCPHRVNGTRGPYSQTPKWIKHIRGGQTQSPDSTPARSTLG